MTAPEPIAVKVTRYRCPFCPRSRSSKQAMREHIARCWHNPANRACRTCTHYTPASQDEWCFPGRPCDCNTYPEGCEHPDGPGELGEQGIRSGCPLWELHSFYRLFPFEDGGES